MGTGDRPRITRADTGLDRRSFLAVAGVLAGPPLAGCVGDDDDADDFEPIGDADDTDDADDVDPEPGGTMRVAMESPLSGLDPAYAGLWVDYSVGSLMHQQLFELNRDYEMEGLLAEDYDISEDGLVWDIHLREGVQFHPPYEGEMTAEDVVYNFDRIADPDVGSPRAAQLEPLESWSAEDDYTFRIELPRQLASLPAWLGFMGLSVLSPDALEEEGDAEERPVGTGPFMFEEYIPRERLHLTAFDDYWEEDIPLLDEVIITPITEAASRVTELETGNIHVDRNPPKDDVPLLEDDPDIEVQEVASGGHRLLWVNPTEDPDDGRAPEKPTTEIEVRQAINEAVDRQAMVDIVDGGFGTPTQTWYPEESPWHVDYAPFSMEANPERAEELIEEAGFDTPLEITILSSPDDAALRDVGQILRDNLDQAGFDPQLDEIEIGGWVERLSGREFDVAIDWIVTQLDPGTMVDSFDQDHYPRALAPLRGIDDELFDLFDSAAETDDDDERRDIYEELQMRLVDHSVNIPTHFRDLVEAHRTTVQDYEVHPHFLNWKDVVDTAWLDE